jgi:drug/metabolite transporter (DMT)-like permease
VSEDSESGADMPIVASTIGEKLATKSNGLAITLVLIIVVLRGFYSPFEVIALRETNAIYFNFATSLMSVPVIMLIMYVRGKRQKMSLISRDLLASVNKHKLLLILIGLTYTINLTCTFAGKLLAHDAAYVTTIKSAQVLPMAIVGMVLFKEKIIPRQWTGLGFIIAGLAMFVFA